MAESCTIGPSRPMEAPELMEHSEDRLRAEGSWRTPMTPRPHRDGFHVVARAALGRAPGPLQYQARQHAAGGRQRQPLPPGRVPRASDTMPCASWPLG